MYGVTLRALVTTNDHYAKKNPSFWTSHCAASCRGMAGAWSGGAGTEHGDEPDDPACTASAASHGLSSPHGLTADVVDRWLAGKSGQLSTDTLACSLLSSSGVPIEDIAHLMGHAATNVPEKVYRRELRFRRGVRRPLWMPFHDDPRFGWSDWQLTGKAPMWRSTGSRRKCHLTRGNAGGRYWI